MSGDLQVRKRRGKSKKKEEVILEAPASRNGSSSSSSGFTASTASSLQLVVGSVDQIRPEKIGVEETRDSAGSGCLAKLLFAFLVSTLLVLAGLIYIHLHSGNSTPLVIQSPNIRIDPAVRNAPVINQNFERENIELASSTSKREREVDIESIEEQIVSDKVIAQMSKEEMVKEVGVEITDTNASATDPVDEPLFVKESVKILGDEQDNKQEAEETKDSDNAQVSETEMADNQANGLEEAEIEETKMEAVDTEDALQKPDKAIENDEENVSNQDNSSTKNEEESAAVMKDTTLSQQDSETVQSPPAISEEIPTDKDLEDGAIASSSLPASDVKQEASSSNKAIPDATNTADKKATQEALKKKRRRHTPPSLEELLPHRNSIERSERLMAAILELSPGHPIVRELRPHLDGVKKDLAEHKLQGLEDTTKHVLLILEDVYVRLADEKEHGHDSTGALPPADQLDDTSAEVPVTAESASSPSVDGATADSSESVKRSPPVSVTAPPNVESPKTSPPLPSKSESPSPVTKAATPPNAGGETKNVPLKQSESVPKQDSTPHAAEKLQPQQKERLARSVPKASGPGNSPGPSNPDPQSRPATAPLQESVPRELSASSGGGVGLDDLTEEDLISAVDTEELTEQMRAAEKLRQEGA